MKNQENLKKRMENFGKLDKFGSNTFLTNNLSLLDAINDDCQKQIQIVHRTNASGC